MQLSCTEIAQKHVGRKGILGEPNPLYSQEQHANLWNSCLGSQAQLSNVLMYIFRLEAESQHSEGTSPRCPVCWAHICLHFVFLRDSWTALTHRKAHLTTFETNNKGIISDKGAIILPSCRKEHGIFLRDYPRPCVLLGDREMWAQQDFLGENPELPCTDHWTVWEELSTAASVISFLTFSNEKKINLSIKDLRISAASPTAKNNNMNLPIPSRSLS